MTRRVERMTQALACFREDVNKDPNNAELLDRMSGVYYSTGEYPKALELLKRAIELKPDYADAYVGVGACYIETKQYNLARTALNRGKDIHRQQKNAAGVLEADGYLQKIP